MVSQLTVPACPKHECLVLQRTVELSEDWPDDTGLLKEIHKNAKAIIPATWSNSNKTFVTSAGLYVEPGSVAVSIPRDGSFALLIHVL